jgi:hypothetical protein
MKKNNSKINKYAPNVSIVNNHMEGFIFRVFLWSFGILALTYILFLGVMVNNIVARKSMEVQARNLTNEVGVLELDYLSLSRNIDLNFSYTKGFKEVKANFATRRSSLGFSNMKNMQNDI